MQIFDTPGSVSLQIKLPSGRVVVTTADEPRTSVELVSLGRRGQDALGEVAVRMDEQGDTHVVTVEQLPRLRWGPLQISWDDAVEVRITCPPGTDLDLASGSAELRVEGELGAVTVRTASGDVQVDRARGALGVKTASGDIAIGQALAEATLTTVSGELEIDSFAGPLGARAVSGDVRIRTVRAPLTVSTTSGDIRIDRVEAGEVQAQSISGDARIGVARGTRVWIDAASVSGTLESQLGFEDAPPDGETAPDTAAVPLRVKTVSGDVAIIRAPESVPAATI
ncbi:MAG: DUF4097 family beta strand repeat-containing protein [Gaiellaceae bacterium]